VATDWTTGVTFPEGHEFFSSPLSPHRPWGPPSFLITWGYFPSIMWTGLYSDQSDHLQLSDTKVQIACSYIFTSPCGLTPQSRRSSKYYNSVRTVMKTPHFIVTKINSLMSFNEIFAACCEEHKKRINKE
jgi:hypothetical protein